MCEPTTLALASFALTAGSTVAGANAQNQAAKANAASAKASGTQQLNALGLRATQETDAAAQQEHGVDQQARSVIASARVAAGENGVTGPSIDALINATQNQASAAKENIQSNLNSTLGQLDSEAAGVNSQVTSRINSVPGANPFVTGLRIGGAAVDTATRLKSYRPAVS